MIILTENHSNVTKNEILEGDCRSPGRQPRTGRTLGKIIKLFFSSKKVTTRVSISFFSIFKGNRDEKLSLKVFLQDLIKYLEFPQLKDFLSRSN